MKFSVNWLRELVDLPANVDELADLLTFAGVEIEGIEKRGLDLAHVVVGQIKASSQHPNADRLSVCEVDDGTNHQRQIVCGAKNYKVGDKVPLALPGAALPNGLKIKASKLRGVESQGMLCSAVELGVSEESDGLLILAPDARIGAPIGSLFPPDIVLDVEITPNRSDLLSYLGLAREIGALTNKPLRPPQIAPPKTVQNEGVKISALRECPFYSALRIENIKVAPSPEWLRAKLESAGLRSINNIVDITNFVMLELGEPLHAFDADKLTGGIHVRLAADGEKFLALDGRTYSLSPNDLMIADAARAVAIGGVMGGEDTGVTDATRNLLLEAAYFLPVSIRRTARTLNLPSDASYRFERGVDPGVVLSASARAAQLIAELAGGQPASETVTAGELPAAPADVTLRYARCHQLLGISVPSTDIERGLTGLGLTSVKKSTEASTWQIPSYRADLKREVDLIEEVVRLHGIDKIPARMRSRFTPVSHADRNYDLEMKMRTKLAALGCHEVRTSKLIPRITRAFDEGAMELRNPLTEDSVAMRRSLLGGLLDVLDRNIRAGAERVAIFEIGVVFEAPQGSEQRRLGIVLWGKLSSELHWLQDRTKRVGFFDLKGQLEAICSEDISLERSVQPFLALSVDVKSSKGLIGLAGQLSAGFTSNHDLPNPIFVAEIALDRPPALLGSDATFREFGRFPAVTRDIALIAPESITHEQVLEVIGIAAPLERVKFFDQLLGAEAAKRFGKGKKSLAYTLTYRDRNRTLTNDEVSAAHAKIRERLQRELGVELRE